MIGIDKDLVATLAGAFVMQQEYQSGSVIRIGGIVEAFFWWGNLGVTLVALANYGAAHWIDRFVYRPRKSLSLAVLLSFAATSLLYFVASQSSALLAPPFAILSVYIVIKLVQIVLGIPNTTSLTGAMNPALRTGTR